MFWSQGDLETTLHMSFQIALPSYKTHCLLAAALEGLLTNLNQASDILPSRLTLLRILVFGIMLVLFSLVICCCSSFRRFSAIVSMPLKVDVIAFAYS